MSRAAGVPGDGLHVIVARDGGVDVATAPVGGRDGDAGVFNVATLEGRRRRGLATALTRRRLHDARERGCVTATLQATPAAEGPYASLGLRDLGLTLEYASPVATARKEHVISSAYGGPDG